jgi:hypothetical protein
MSDSNREFGQNTDAAIRRRKVLASINSSAFVLRKSGDVSYWDDRLGWLSAADLRIIADEVDRRSEVARAAKPRDDA